MTNPCKECIVQAACTDTCGEFVDYVTKQSRGMHHHYKNIDYEYAANLIRDGSYELFDNDTKWRRRSL